MSGSFLTRLGGRFGTIRSSRQQLALAIGLDEAVRLYRRGGRGDRERAGEEALRQKKGATRVCTFRAVGGCTLWGLDIAELAPLLKIFPAMTASLQAESPSAPDRT